MGALVADAAALGLNWIYDLERLASVGGATPEFRDPDLEAYRGTTAYFAHKGKRAGDPTHYGEQLLVLLRSLAATGGRFDAVDYERRFADAFGPGGTWVGYIDYATRQTLRNLDRAEQDALRAARSVDLGPHERDRALLEAKVLAHARRWRGDKLAQAIEKAVRVTHPGDDALVRAAQSVARAVEGVRGSFHGAEDSQLPAVSKLPALVAFGGTEVEAAVRVTNDDDAAVQWGGEVARMLEAAREGATPRKALSASGLDRFDGAAESYGRACMLADAVPLTAALLRDAADFEGTIRRNILLGGDAAGRGIVLGAVLGAAFGVPPAWRDRTYAVAEADALLGA